MRTQFLTNSIKGKIKVNLSPLILSPFLLLASLPTFYLLINFSYAWGASPLKIIAHRGASYKAPENTMASFKLAFQEDADGIEGDVFLTKDRKIVVFHDEDLMRICGQQGKIEEKTYAELGSCDAGSWKDSEYQNEKIPLLEDVVKMLPPHKLFFIEIKSANKEIVDHLLALLDHYPEKREQLFVISFHLDIMNLFRKKTDKYKAFYVTAAQKGSFGEDFVIRNQKDLEELVKIAIKNKIDGIDFEFDPFLSKASMDLMHKKGLISAVWCYEKDDTIANMKKGQSFGINYFTSNFPGKMKDAISEKVKI